MTSHTPAVAARGGNGNFAVSALAVLALVAAAVCAVWFGYRGYQAYFEQKPTQTTRDAAVDGAEQAALNVTTVDPKNLPAWTKRIDASLTGKAHDQVNGQSLSNLNQMISQAGPQAATLSSRLVRSAPVEVDTDDNKAKVLVYVAATSKRANEAGVTQTMGFSVSMTKVGDNWKANDIVPLDSVSYQDQGSAPGGGDQGAPAPAPGAPAAPAPAAPAPAAAAPAAPAPAAPAPAPAPQGGAG